LTTQGKNTFINISPETVKMEATVTSDKNKTSAVKDMLILDSSSQDEAEDKGKRGCLLLSLNVDNRELPEN
jgi:hypothetical protein